MFAALAFVCFLLVLLTVSVPHLNLVVLGFALIALHLAVGGPAINFASWKARRGE